MAFRSACAAVNCLITFRTAVRLRTPGGFSRAATFGRFADFVRSCFPLPGSRLVFFTDLGCSCLFFFAETELQPKQHH